MRPHKLHWFWSFTTGKIKRPHEPTLFIRRISGSESVHRSRPAIRTARRTRHSSIAIVPQSTPPAARDLPPSSLCSPHRPPRSSPLSLLARGLTFVCCRRTCLLCRRSAPSVVLLSSVLPCAADLVLLSPFRAVCRAPLLRPFSHGRPGACLRCSA